MSKYLWIGLGWLTLGLAIIGIALPVLPTTPFLLLAAFFFSKGSPRIHQWILNHRWFGPPIRDWQAGMGISLKAKISAIGLMWVSIGYAAWYVVPIVAVKILLIIIAIGVTIFLIKVKTKSIS